MTEATRMYADHRWPSLWWDDYDGITVGLFKEKLREEEEKRRAYLEELRAKARRVNEMMEKAGKLPLYSREQIIDLQIMDGDDRAPNLYKVLDYLDAYLLGGDKPTIHVLYKDYSTGGFLCVMYDHPVVTPSGITLQRDSFVIGLVQHGDGRWGTHS